MNGKRRVIFITVLILLCAGIAAGAVLFLRREKNLSPEEAFRAQVAELFSDAVTVRIEARTGETLIDAYLEEAEITLFLQLGDTPVPLDAQVALLGSVIVYERCSVDPSGEGFRGLLTTLTKLPDAENVTKEEDGTLIFTPSRDDLEEVAQGMKDAVLKDALLLAGDNLVWRIPGSEEESVHNLEFTGTYGDVSVQMKMRMERTTEAENPFLKETQEARYDITPYLGERFMELIRRLSEEYGDYFF